MNNADIISLIDLTSLNDDDTQARIEQLCQQANTSLGPVAAVCVYPEFIQIAKKTLVDTNISVATVANFPAGNDTIETTLKSITQSLADGADEIDVVMPYKKLIECDTEFVSDFLLRCRELTTGHHLKVIIESGALTTSQITQATSIAAAIGADFVKTSTGKIKQGASLESVDTILKTLSSINDAPGIKISGGVRTPEQAQDYLKLIADYMSKEWITPNNVRIGASKLLNQLLNA